MMKLRWGTAIVLSFVLFIGFMGYMVFQIFKNPDLQHSLVTPNYYQKEQTLNILIQSKKNAKHWHGSIEHLLDKQNVRIGPLPTDAELSVIGYCPSDVTKDFAFHTTLNPKNPYVSIPKSTLGATQWELRFQWQKNDSLFVIDYPLFF